MPKKKRDPAQYQVGDKVFYLAYGGGEYPGVITEQDWMHYGKPTYRIHIPKFRDGNPADISSYEDHILPGQRSLFAKREPKFAIGDIVEYTATDNALWVVTRAVYRPKKGYWIYWIKPKEQEAVAPKEHPGLSVWEWDIFPTQGNFKFEGAKKPPVFQVGDEVVFKANPNINGIIVKVKKQPASYHIPYTYEVKYKKPNGEWYKSFYSSDSLMPNQQSLVFPAKQKYQVGDMVNTYHGPGKVVRVQSPIPGDVEDADYLIKLISTGSSVWYTEGLLEPFIEMTDPNKLEKPETSGRMELSKKRSNWIEKSRDMYRFEQKPVGKDRKQILGPQLPKVQNTFLELPERKEAKTKPQYLQGDSVGVPHAQGLVPGRVTSYFWSNEQQAYFYRVNVGNPGEEHEMGLWEIQLRPMQQRLFASKIMPKFKEGDYVVIKGGDGTPFRVRTFHLRNKEPIYKIDNIEDYSYHYVPESRLEFQQQQKGLFAMKVNAGELVRFDPSKRKIKTGPGTGIQEIGLTPEMQEERDAVFYAYDSMLIDLKELENNMLALGESDIANNISEALKALRARF